MAFLYAQRLVRPRPDSIATHAPLPLSRLILLPLLLFVAAQGLRAQVKEPAPGSARCMDADIFNDLMHRGDSTYRMKVYAADGRPENLPKFLVSREGHFRIHYTDVGNNAPPLRDVDHNSVPDYIDSLADIFEHVRHVEIDQYGYTAPPPETLRDGPEIDIYVYDLDPQYYGGAQPETDNRVDDKRVLGYIVMDNDYVERTYSTHGLDAVRVTAAHEFHHFIQFGSYRFDYAQAAIFEATAVWFERQVYPSIPDYLQYVDTFLVAPQLYPISTNDVSHGIIGYAHNTFLDYAAKKAKTPDVVRQMWEQFSDDDAEFTAMDAALRMHGMNLEDGWCEYARWCYFTGARTLDSLYFDAAGTYTTMQAARRSGLTSSNDVFFQGSLGCLSFGLYQVTIPHNGGSTTDTVDFIVTNAKGDIGQGTEEEDDFTIEVTKTPMPGYTALTFSNDTVLYYKFDSQSTHFCLDVVRNGSVFNTPAVRISPQPFINDGANQLVFGVDLARDQVKNISLWIFSADLTPVAEIHQFGFTEAYNQLGVVWDGRDRNGRLAPSGVYFYQLEVEDSARVLGKFAIVAR
jgi:hypothetical protein